MPHLVKCNICGGNLASDAVACPHCGSQKQLKQIKEAEKQKIESEKQKKQEQIESEKRKKNEAEALIICDEIRKKGESLESICKIFHVYKSSASYSLEIRINQDYDFSCTRKLLEEILENTSLFYSCMNEIQQRIKPRKKWFERDNINAYRERCHKLELANIHEPLAEMLKISRSYVGPLFIIGKYMCFQESKRDRYDDPWEYYADWVKCSKNLTKSSIKSIFNKL